MPSYKIVLAEAEHRTFINSLLNSDHLTDRGMRRLSGQSLEGMMREGYYFDLNTGSGFLIVLEAAQSKPIGLVRLSTNLAHQYSVVNLGILPEYCGQSIGPRILKLTASFLFKTYPIQRLEANILASNEPSVRAARKSGFVVEGVKRNAWFCDGKLQDQIVLGILRADLVISLHLNGDSKKVKTEDNGVCGYTNRQSASYSGLFCSIIRAIADESQLPIFQEQDLESVGPGLFFAPYLKLMKFTNKPILLIEGGFQNNASELFHMVTALNEYRRTGIPTGRLVAYTKGILKGLGHAI